MFPAHAPFFMPRFLARAAAIVAREEE